MPVKVFKAMCYWWICKYKLVEKVATPQLFFLPKHQMKSYFQAATTFSRRKGGGGGYDQDVILILQGYLRSLQEDCTLLRPDQACHGHCTF